MPIPLKDVGRDPDADASVADRQYIVDRFRGTNVTQADVDAEVARQTGSLATKVQVDSGDAGAVKRTYVTQQDALYLPKSSVGAANGVATLDSNGLVPVTQLANMPNRYPVVYDITTGFGGVSSYTGTTTSLRTLAVPDPGYRFRPIISGYFEARCETGAGQENLPVVDILISGSAGSGVIATGYAIYGKTDWNTISVVPAGFGAGASNPQGLAGSFTVTARAVRAGSNGTCAIGSFQAYLNIILIPCGG